MDKHLLPSGHHRGLDIRVGPLTPTGDFDGGRWKMIWHTTEGLGLGTMVRVLREKRAEPHCVIDPESGGVVQLIRFDQYAKALEHPTGTPETNRAHCIQIEICGFAKNSPDWNEHIYRNLARLALLIEHRIPIPRVSRHVFKVGASRLTPNGFIGAAGHLGHEHVPNQPTKHWDPGAMRAKHLLRLMGEV